jgi:UDP-2-acetamido-2,6-beta-L-arabino-hexul-4-ose reductase
MASSTSTGTMNIVVTGTGGFIGRNLVAWLNRRSDCCVFPYDLGNTQEELVQALSAADLVFHLAGVNRPLLEREFQTGNVDFTSLICDVLLKAGRHVPVVLSSSIQAAQDNPYGVSKRQAEAVVTHYAQTNGARAMIYRLHNVFGKWCRPNYNSVVATFCHNIAHDLPITISDPARELELIHVDDVAAHFMQEIGREGAQSGVEYRSVSPSYKVTLGALAEKIRFFRQSRTSLRVPDLSDDFTRKLYGTYLAYLEPNDFAYNLDKKCDARGCLAEFVKSPPFGQIFVSRTAPGITRGNHYHHLKTEKFLVVEGDAIVRFRHIESGQVIEYSVHGTDFRVVDIPPGYTHSLENVGSGELVTLFWASEIFDPSRPDTNALSVIAA